MILFVFLERKTEGGGMDKKGMMKGRPVMEGSFGSKEMMNIHNSCRVHGHGVCLGGL